MCVLGAFVCVASAVLTYRPSLSFLLPTRITTILSVTLLFSRSSCSHRVTCANVSRLTTHTETQTESDTVREGDWPHILHTQRMRQRRLEGESWEDETNKKTGLAGKSGRLILDYDSECHFKKVLCRTVSRHRRGALRWRLGSTTV